MPSTATTKLSKSEPNRAHISSRQPSRKMAGERKQNSLIHTSANVEFCFRSPHSVDPSGKARSYCNSPEGVKGVKKSFSDFSSGPWLASDFRILLNAKLPTPEPAGPRREELIYGRVKFQQGAEEVFRSGLLKSAPSRREVSFFGPFPRVLEAKKFRLASFSRWEQQPKNKWRRRGSNPQPPACKAGALPIELRPQPSSARRKIRTSDLVVISDAL